MLLLKIKNEILLKPIILTSGISEKKHHLSTLAHILLEYKNEVLMLTATDMEIQMSISTNIGIDGTEFSIILPHKKLHDILRLLPPNEEIRLLYSDDKKYIIIENNYGTYQILCSVSEHYPLIENHESPQQTVKIKHKQFKTALNNTIYAVSDKDNRLFLTGILLEVYDNKFKLVATDAHRLSVYENCTVEDVQEQLTALIPKKTAVELNKLLEYNEGKTFTINFYPLYIEVMLNYKKYKLTIISKLIDSKYPDYKMVIPTSNNKSFSVGKEILLKALERCSVITNSEKFNKDSVMFLIGHNELELFAQNQQNEYSKNAIPIGYDAEDTIKIALNTQYVKDILNNIMENNITINFLDDSSSILITTQEDSNFLSVIMPLLV